MKLRIRKYQSTPEILHSKYVSNRQFGYLLEISPSTSQNLFKRIQKVQPTIQITSYTVSFMTVLQYLR